MKKRHVKQERNFLMKQLLLRVKNFTIKYLFVIALLVFLCTNISEAQLEAGQQSISLLPISSSAAGATDYDYRGTSQESGANFILELVPGAFLFSPDADGFEVYYYNGYYYESETIDGIGSWMPNLRAGLRINSPVVSFDFTGGGGYLVNGAVGGAFFMLDFATNFHVAKGFSIGPHIGVIPFYDELEWFGDADVEIYGHTGVMGGLVMTAGGSNARFYMSLDYIQADFDVDIDNGWIVGDDTLDMSGLGLQLGVLFKF